MAKKKRTIDILLEEVEPKPVQVSLEEPRPPVETSISQTASPQNVRRGAPTYNYAAIVALEGSYEGVGK